MIGGAAAPDPFLLFNIPEVQVQTAGRAVRSLVINPAERTLVLISSGQSLASNTSGALFTPTNASKIDNFNVNDGAAYDCAGPLLGPSTDDTLGPGNVVPRVADKLITGNKFDRVIIPALAIGGTAIAEWATGNYSQRHLVAMRRLAARGITPATPGVTFCFLWMQGETDGNLGTTSAQYQSRWATVRANLFAAGFSGRIFNPTETMAGAGVTNATMQGAQAAIRDGSVVFSGGNLDTDAPYSNRVVGNSHLTATSAAQAATAIYNAMVASGAPYA